MAEAVVSFWEKGGLHNTSFIFKDQKLHWIAPFGDDIQTREAFKKRRCLISTDGFYEWKGQKETKQSMFITLPDKSPLSFAGLWESWRDKQDSDVIYRSWTIITRDATGPVRELHHRMPVILDPEA
jgi:putative SOS response-associated peptidase YedK